MENLKKIFVVSSAFILTGVFVGYGFDGEAVRRSFSETLRGPEFPGYGFDGEAVRRSPPFASTSFASILEALQKGDIRTFRKQIGSRLKEDSFEEFILLLESADASGQTLFHGFAKAKKNKKQAEKELKNLLKLLSFSLKKSTQPKNRILAGVKIPSSRTLEEESVAKAVKGGSFQDISNELKNLVKKGSAVRAFSILHGTTSSGETLYGLIMKRLENSYNSEEELTRAQNQVQRAARELRDHLTNLPFQKDSLGLTPLDTAEENNNKRIYEVLYNENRRFKSSERRASLKRGGGFLSAGASALWLSGGFSISELFTFVAAGTFGVFVGEKCYDSLKSFFERNAQKR